jgi:hypothetical protein
MSVDHGSRRVPIVSAVVQTRSGSAQRTRVERTERRQVFGLVVGVCVTAAVMATGITVWRSAPVKGVESPRIPEQKTRLSILVETEPSEASIELSGRRVGQTPGTIDLEPGAHTLVLRKDGYDPEPITVNLSPESPFERRSITLHPKSPNAVASVAATTSAGATSENGGLLSFDTVPSSRVWEGDRPLGTTPLVRVPLSAGMHILVLENPASGTRMTYALTIPPNESITRSLALE